MNIAAILERSSGLHGPQPAVAHGVAIHRTYAGLLDEVRRLAGGLRGLGVGPGDRVAFFMTNQPDYVALEFAVWWLGAAIVPVNAKLHRREVAHIVADSGARLAFVCARTAADVAGLDAEIATLERIVPLGSADHRSLRESDPVAAPAPVDDHDLAWLFYTSGTTGFPKGAMITHRNLFAMATGYLTDVDSIPPDATLVHLAPMSHGSGFYTLPFMAMGAVSVVPRSGGFDEAEFFELAAHWPAVSAFVAPTMMRRLTAHAAACPVDSRNLRCMVYGGGPLFLADLKEAAARFGPVFAQIYGQGECPMTITAMHRDRFSSALAAGDDACLQSVGTPFLGTELRIVGPGGSALGPGETGEIAVRSPTGFKGYWRNEAGTRSTIRDGWVMTGDLGTRDARGLVTLAGRSKEVIISAGTNIYPIEVENVLTTHPRVVEAAVVGLPDPEWGESVAAFVAVAGDAAGIEAELDALCIASIARFKRPKRYFIRASLPKNAYGKIVKRELVASLAADSSAERT